MPSSLFSPIALRDLTLPNRLWIAPMCQYSVELEDGAPADWHLLHLGSLATGGAGLIITEATAVSAEGRISPQDTGIWNDAQAAAWSRIVDAVHGQGAAIAVQLAHAGRKGSTYRPWAEESGSVPGSRGGWPTVAPSAVAFPGYAIPEELGEDGIRQVVADFAAGARRARQAGFDAVELHAAHGYLLHQFLSPLSNRRDDRFGGGLENRARIVLDAIRAVRAAVGERMPVILRVSATDWVEGGLDEHEVATVSRWAVEAGADLIDVSTGGNAPASIPVGPEYQVPFATHIREAAGVPVGAVGLITEPQQAEDVVASGRADVVLIARAALRNPRFPLEAASVLGAEVPWPPQYERGKPRQRAAAGSR